MFSLTEFATALRTSPTKKSSTLTLLTTLVIVLNDSFIIVISCVVSTQLRYELLYSEKSNDPTTRWTPEEHLLSDFFVFSLTEFATALRTSPRAVVEHAIAAAKQEATRAKEAKRQSYARLHSAFP